MPGQQSDTFWHSPTASQPGPANEHWCAFQTAVCTDDTAEQAFERADRALCRAKHNERNRCELA